MFSDGSSMSSTCCNSNRAHASNADFWDNVTIGFRWKISGGAYAYRSSKAAVNMVMKSLALDLAPRGISCVVMHPGWVRTDMGGAGGKLSPSESVAAVRKVIAGLGPKDSGTFLNHDGKPYPW